MDIINSKMSGKIIIDLGGIKRIQNWIDELNPFKVGIITNNVVARFWLNPVFESLNDNVSTFIINDGEEFKELNTVESIWRGLIEKRFTRKSLVIGLGGGVITDIAGFVASTYMRGIKLMQIPTSLMAQVDAAIGGKTGINFLGKNIIGTFYPADLVLIDPATLSTLQEDDFVSGLAEVVKYGVIKDRKFFNFLEENSKRISPHEESLMVEIIKRSIKIKIQVVDRDLYENDLRRILNFGHTVAHGLEKASNYQLKHGFAVSIGMVINCFIAEDLLNFRESGRIIELLKSLRLPTSFSLDPRTVLEAMKIDKKAWYGKFVFVLPTRIGNVVVKEVDEDIVLNALKRGFV